MFIAIRKEKKRKQIPEIPQKSSQQRTKHKPYKNECIKRISIFGNGIPYRELINGSKVDRVTEFKANRLFEYSTIQHHPSTVLSTLSLYCLFFFLLVRLGLFLQYDLKKKFMKRTNSERM